VGTTRFSSAELLLDFSGLDKSMDLHLLTASNVSFELLSLAPSVAVWIAILAAASEPSKANDKRQRRIMNSANLIARMLQTPKRREIDGYIYRERERERDPQDYSLKSDI